MKKAKAKMWAVLTRGDNPEIITKTLSDSEQMTKQAFFNYSRIGVTTSGDPWKHAELMGYRCVRVEVKELP